MSFTCARTGKHTKGKPARVITEVRAKRYPPRDTGKNNPKDEGGDGWEIAKEVNMSHDAAIAFCCSKPGLAIEKAIGRPASSVALPTSVPQLQVIRQGIVLDPNRPPPVTAPKI